MTSIRRYLVTLLIALLTLTSFLAALQSYRLSSAQAQKLFDDDLKALAASVLAPYLPDDPHSTSTLAEANAIQLWQGGQLVYHSAQTSETLLSAADGYSEQNFAGKRWQTFRQSIDDLTVIVAQPLQDRLALSDQVVLASIYPVVLSLPLQAGTNSGDYRIEILTDTNNALNEADRSNNNGASAALAVSVPPLANLVVRDVAAPAAVGVQAHGAVVDGDLTRRLEREVLVGAAVARPGDDLSAVVARPHP